MLTCVLSMFKGIQTVANVIPNIDQIKKSRQAPTPGELHLLEALSLMFDENTNVFFNLASMATGQTLYCSIRSWGL